MANQLSGVRPRALERRNAISGLMPLWALISQFRVEAATPKFLAR